MADINKVYDLIGKIAVVDGTPYTIVDPTVTPESTNPVQSKGIYEFVLNELTHAVDGEAREEIANIMIEVNNLDQKIDSKMEFYKIDYAAGSLSHDGVTLTYAEIINKYNDPKYFVYVEGEGYTYIPTLPPLEGDEIIEFSSTYLYGGHAYTSRVIINSLNQIKHEEIRLLRADEAPEGGVTKEYVDTQDAALQSQIDNELAEIRKLDTAIMYTETRTVYLGYELINGVTLSAGWSGSLESGLRHTSGSTNILEFDTVTEVGASYCLEFDTTYGADEFVKVGIGDVYRTYVYNNRTHIIVFLYSDGGVLKIEPLSTFNGTLSNLSLKKVQETGTPLEVNINLVSNKEITSNNGFWNTLLGGDNALFGYGITRSVAIGNRALESIKSGNRNVAIGTFALNSMQGGEGNISVGSDSMYSVTEADGCIALGMGTMQYGKHESDLAFGFNALKGYGTDPVDTKFNIAIGIYAGYKNRANYNIFIGRQSGYNNTSGHSNIGIGNNALRLNTTGRQNIAIGSEANAKDQTSNCIIIGNNITTTKSNQVIIGSTTNTELVFLGNKKIIFNADGTVTWETLT